MRPLLVLVPLALGGAHLIGACSSSTASRTRFIEDDASADASAVPADAASDGASPVDTGVDAELREAASDSPHDQSTMDSQDARSEDARSETAAGPTYAATVLADGALAYWRMGIKSGLSVADATGVGNDLLLQGGGHTLGAPGAIANDSDTAIGFDGTGSFAIATNSRALDFASSKPFTLECWAQRASSGGGYYQHLLSNVVGSANARDGYSLYLLPSASGSDTARSSFEYNQPANEIRV